MQSNKGRSELFIVISIVMLVLYLPFMGMLNMLLTPIYMNLSQRGPSGVAWISFLSRVPSIIYLSIVVALLVFALIFMKDSDKTAKAA